MSLKCQKTVKMVTILFCHLGLCHWTDFFFFFTSFFVWPTSIYCKKFTFELYETEKNNKSWPWRSWIQTMFWTFCMTFYWHLAFIGLLKLLKTTLFLFASSRPFHVEPRNIIDDDPQERVSSEAAILNSRVHYYSRLTGSSDRLLVSQITN